MGDWWGGRIWFGVDNWGWCGWKGIMLGYFEQEFEAELCELCYNAYGYPGLGVWVHDVKFGSAEAECLWDCGNGVQFMLAELLSLQLLFAILYFPFYFSLSFFLPLIFCKLLLTLTLWTSSKLHDLIIPFTPILPTLYTLPSLLPYTLPFFPEPTR